MLFVPSVVNLPSVFILKFFVTLSSEAARVYSSNSVEPELTSDFLVLIDKRAMSFF